MKFESAIYEGRVRHLTIDPYLRVFEYPIIMF